jgi:hypothetical protein
LLFTPLRRGSRAIRSDARDSLQCESDIVAVGDVAGGRGRNGRPARNVPVGKRNSGRAGLIAMNGDCVRRERLYRTSGLYGAIRPFRIVCAKKV